MIQITPKEFEQLYTRRYLKLPCSNKGTATILLHPVGSFDPQNESLLFISDLKSIEVPGHFDTQMVKSLYGVPGGLFETSATKKKSKPSRESKKKRPVTESEPNVTESYFVRLRAALLFATVWFEKSFGSKAMVDLSEQLLNQSTFAEPAVKAFLLSLSQHTGFPERTPSNVTLDTTRFDNNWNWLGVQLAQICFAPDNKMDADHKQWFVQLIKTGNQQQPAPEKFRALEPFIRGYITAIATRQKNLSEVTDLFDGAAFFSTDATSRLHHTFMALLFMGLFDPQAHCYFLTAGGRPLMRFLERLAWSAATNQPLASDALKKEAHDGLLHLEESPMENCIHYYRFKNSAIAHKDWFEYAGGLGAEYPAKTALVTETEAPVFLHETGRFVDLPAILEELILVAPSLEEYRLLAQAGLHAVYSGPHSLYASLNGWPAAGNPTNPFVALTPGLTVPPALATRKNSKPQTIDTLFPKNHKGWVLFTNEGLVPGWMALLLKSLLLQKKPEVILSINFTYNGQVPAEGNTLWNSNAMDAQTLHQITGDTTIREVRQVVGTPVWETVALSTGVLAGYDYHQLMVLDTRPLQNSAEAANILFRCTRDVILYDQTQKYMTMNINRI